MGKKCVNLIFLKLNNKKSLNSFGEIGDGTSGTNRLSPVAVLTTIIGGKQFLQISTGKDHTCASTNDTNYCWGRNK